MNRRISALAAALTFGLVGNANLGEIPPPQTPKQRKRWADRRDYPRTGTGMRQGKRVERQVRGAFTHPFAASLLCIDRIRARRPLSARPRRSGSASRKSASISVGLSSAAAIRAAIP